MVLRVRRTSIFLVVLAAAAVLAPAGVAGKRASAPPAYPTLYVKYTMNCTFTIQDDDGKRVSSIAPGTYQVEVSTPLMFKLVVPGGEGIDHLEPNDFTGCRGWVQFQLTGPGVDLFTTLDTGCDAFLLLPPQNFKAGSSYTAQDLNQPAVTRTALTVLQSGTAPVPKTPYTATSDKGQTFSDIVGSAVRNVLRTKLTGTLSATGKPTLTKQGAAVSKLKAGNYRFVITDRDSKHSFTLKAVNGKSTGLSGVRFVGKKTTNIRLSPGRWMYTAGGKAYYFQVT